MFEVYFCLVVFFVLGCVRFLVGFVSLFFNIQLLAFFRTFSIKLEGLTL